MKKIRSLMVFSTLFCIGSLYGEDLPPKRLEIKGDFLYWYANQSGLEYTTKKESVITTSNWSEGSLVKPTFDWEPGVRIDVMYGFEHLYWSLGADAILYWGNGHGSKQASDIEGIFPVFSFAPDSLPTDYANDAHLHWHLSATIIDVLFSYEWIYNSYFTLIPSLGVRSAWLDQKATVSYEGATFQAAPDIVHLESHFLGIGPRFAVKPQFFLGSGVSFYLEGALSIFDGWFHVEQLEQFANTVRARVNRHPEGMRLGVDTTTGFAYTYHINRRISVTSDLGFDYSVFFRQNEFVHGENHAKSSQGSALTLYGAHASIGFSF